MFDTRHPARCRDLNPNYYVRGGVSKDPRLHTPLANQRQAFPRHASRRAHQRQTGPRLSTNLSNQSSAGLPRPGLLWAGSRVIPAPLWHSLAPHTAALATVVYAGIALTCSLVYSAGKHYSKKNSGHGFNSTDDTLTAGARTSRHQQALDTETAWSSPFNPMLKWTSLTGGGATTSTNTHITGRTTSSVVEPSAPFFPSCQHIASSACLYMSEGLDRLFPRRQRHQDENHAKVKGTVGDVTTSSITSAILASCSALWSSTPQAAKSLTLCSGRPTDPQVPSSDICSGQSEKTQRAFFPNEQCFNEPQLVLGSGGSCTYSKVKGNETNATSPQLSEDTFSDILGRIEAKGRKAVDAFEGGYGVHHSQLMHQSSLEYRPTHPELHKATNASKINFLNFDGSTAECSAPTRSSILKRIAGESSSLDVRPSVSGSNFLCAADEPPKRYRDGVTGGRSQSIRASVWDVDSTSSGRININSQRPIHLLPLLLVPELCV